MFKGNYFRFLGFYKPDFANYHQIDLKTFPYILSHLHECVFLCKSLLTLALKIAKVSPSTKGDLKMTRFFFVDMYKYYYFFRKK